MLGVELAAVLVGPTLLLWTQYKPQPWDWRTLRVRFESARYEMTSLVFTYQIENRTRRSVRLLPEVTKVLVRQDSGSPPVGFPEMQLPLELEAHSSQKVEVRLQLPSRKLPTWSDLPEDQVKQMLRMAMPEAADANQPVWPLPPNDRLRSAPEGDSRESVVETTLQELNGFELVNESKGVHLVLPRGW